MRLGDNVQNLFASNGGSLLRCVKSSDLEETRPADLSIANYSTEEPEAAIVAVNTLIQDSQHQNPVIRGLAVRTVCRIWLENVTENMVIPARSVPVCRQGRGMRCRQTLWRHHRGGRERPTLRPPPAPSP
jgi:vesicle coat complex subunit